MIQSKVQTRTSREFRAFAEVKWGLQYFWLPKFVFITLCSPFSSKAVCCWEKDPFSLCSIGRDWWKICWVLKKGFHNRAEPRLLNSNDPHSLITKTNEMERSLFNQIIVRSQLGDYSETQSKVWNLENNPTERQEVREVLNAIKKKKKITINDELYCLSSLNVLLWHVNTKLDNQHHTLDLNWSWSFTEQYAWMQGGMWCILT